MTYTASLNQTISLIPYLDTQQQTKKTKPWFSVILDQQFLIKQCLTAKQTEEDINNPKESDSTVFAEDSKEQNSMDTASTQTQVIEEKNIKETYTNTYGNVAIKNASKYTLTDDILKPDLTLEDKKDILIFHTHTCESYTPTEQMSYDMMGSYRTTDLQYSVVRVGNALAEQMEKRGYTVKHDTTVNDYPAFTGSYKRSMEAVKKDLEENSSTQIVFDLHRDAVGSKNDYAPVVRIGEDYVAQIMFVIGTDGGGLYHPNWQQNLKFAVAVQQVANEKYPGLFRPIIVRDSRYNQHLAKAATIIEVGATGNTLEQCIGSMKYFSDVLDEVLRK